ncbi:hypothetical protein AGLY_006903 [Aphis glycines]|uniref:Uncharacterized protein n=1 Tax=Aphis glycines TaxID=307491 RepID=A0A6G0TQ56_APHGL|nr:hypothetical protein AGLY_006903 [Aphis glycines]
MLIFFQLIHILCSILSSNRPCNRFVITGGEGVFCFVIGPSWCPSDIFLFLNKRLSIKLKILITYITVDRYVVQYLAALHHFLHLTFLKNNPKVPIFFNGPVTVGNETPLLLDATEKYCLFSFTKTYLYVQNDYFQSCGLNVTLVPHHQQKLKQYHHNVESAYLDFQTATINYPKLVIYLQHEQLLQLLYRNGKDGFEEH